MPTLNSQPPQSSGKAPIRVLLTLGNALVRSGLRTCITGQTGVELAGEAPDMARTLPQIEGLRPDVIVLDEAAVVELRTLGATLPNGTSGNPPALILLAENGTPELLDSALGAGVKGFLDPSTATEALLPAIRQVASGERYMSPGLLPKLVKREENSSSVDSSPEEILTERELEVFQLTGEGFEAKEIGDRLSISPRTVDVHRANIRQKLGLNSVHELMRFATAWQQNRARADRLQRFCREKRPLLLVEDDEVDVLSLERALARLPAAFPIEVARHGEAALQWLRSEGHPLPFLILLDINMPRMNGHEFLTELRRDPMLRTLPVAVLTTSPHESDRDRLYQLGIMAYLVKPTRTDEYVEMLRSLAEFWSFNSPPPFPRRPNATSEESVISSHAV
ncbi:MAG: response regulator [Verrucomicrobiales bacterium]|nr:response regulator [Verrucomicrobiales bacterium]